MTEQEPKIQIDADWKAQARAEKERLAREAEKTEAQRGDRPRPGELPAADMRALVSLLATQALASLGAFGDPKSGRIMVDIVGAKFSIDLLSVLQDKTKGNITAEESQELSQALTELRARFVEISQLVARQGAQGAEPK